jgi:hypothetical protein
VDIDGSVSGIPLAEQIARCLAAQGVDVDAALRDLGYAEERRKRRAEARVQRAGDLRFYLRRARDALRYEQAGWEQGAPGFTLAKVTAAQTLVTRLDGQYREACLNNQETMDELARRAGR